MCTYTRSGKPRGYPRVLLAPLYLADSFQLWGGNDQSFQDGSCVKAFQLQWKVLLSVSALVLPVTLVSRVYAPPFLLSLLRVRPERNSCDSSRGQRFVAQVLSLS